MYAAVPGKTNVLAIRLVEAAKSAQKPAAPAPVVAVTHECAGFACSCKGFHDEFSRKDPYQFNMRSGKEHRKCKHSHFGRRGRRAVVIFH